MKERPILFSAAMVRAILAGTKTQTRRLVKPQPNVTEQRLRELGAWAEGFTLSEQVNAAYQSGFIAARCPYGQPGDRLWVRETWQHSNFPLGSYDDSCQAFYRADYMDDPHGPDGEKSPEGKYRNWKPAIHMPRSASRILLEITSVRVERLQDISEADAFAEGIKPFFSGGVDPTCFGINERSCGFGTAGSWRFHDTPKQAYRVLWEHINGSGSWNANPWVWVISFNKV